MNISNSMDLAKDAYAWLTDSKRTSSLAKSAYKRIELEAQSLSAAAAKNKKTLLSVAALAATVAGIYLYGSDLVSYMEKTCSTQGKTSSSQSETSNPPLSKFRPASSPSPYPFVSQTSETAQSEYKPIVDPPIVQTGTKITNSSEHFEPFNTDQWIRDILLEGERISTFFSKAYKIGAVYEPAIEAGMEAVETGKGAINRGTELIRSKYEYFYPLAAKAAQVWEHLPGAWDLFEAFKSVLPSPQGKKLDECVMNLVKDSETTASDLIRKCSPGVFSTTPCNTLRRQIRSVRKQIHPDKIGNEDPYKLFAQFVDSLSKNNPSCRINS